MATQELLVRLGLEDSSFTKKMQGLNKELKVIDTGFKELSSRTTDFAKTTEGIGAKITTLSKKLEVYGEASKLIIEKQKETGKELEGLKNKYSLLEGSIEKTKSKLDDAKKSLDNSKNASEQLGKRVQELEDKKQVFKNLADTIEGTSDKVKAHKENIEKVSKEYKEYENKVASAKVQISNYERAVESLQSDIDKQTSTLDKLTAKEKALNEEIKLAEKNYKSASVELGENSKKAEDLRKKLENLKKKQEEVKTSVTNTKTKLKELNGEYTNAKNKAEQYKEKVSLLEKTLESTGQELKSHKDKLKETETAYQNAKNELDKYGLKHSDVKNKIKELQEQINREKESIKLVDAETEKHRATIKALEKQLEGEYQQLDKTTRAIEGKQKQLQSLQVDLNNTKTKINETTIELKQAQLELDNFNLNKFSQTMKEASAKFGEFGKKATGLGATLTGAITTPIVGIGKKAFDISSEFEQQMRKVNATFDRSGVDMDERFASLSESARDFARVTEWTAQEVGKAYEYFAMSGASAEKSTSSMLPMLNLATIGMVDLGEATDIITDTMTPFSRNLQKVRKEAEANGKSFDEAKYMVDMFAQIISSSNTDVTKMGETLKYASATVSGSGADFEDMAVAIGIMANSAIKGSSSGTSLATGINRLLAPTEKAVAMMEKYGIEVQATKDGELDLMATMEMLREKMGQMNRMEQQRVAKVIFGQTAQKGWLPIINATTEEWNKMKDAMANADGVSDEMMSEMQKSGAYAFKIMQSSIQDLLIVLGDGLAPAIVSITTAIGNFARKLSDTISYLQKNNPALLEFIGKLTLLAAVIPPIVTAIGLFCMGLSGITGAISSVIGWLVKMKTESGMLSAGLQALGSKFTALGSFIGTTTGAITLGTTALVGIMAVIGENENALGWLIEKWGGFGEVVARACEMVSGIVELTIGNVLLLFQGGWRSIKAIFTKEKIGDVWGETLAKVRENSAVALSNIVGDSSTALKTIGQMTATELSGVRETFKTVFDALPKITKDNLEQTAKTMTDSFATMSEQSLNIMRGTSDTMVTLLQGIHEGMDNTEMVKKLEKNMDTLLQAGKLDADELKKEFKKANDLISQHMKGSFEKASKEAEDIINKLSKTATKGVENVSTDVTKIVEEMDSETFNTLSKMGGTWSKIFEDIKKDGSMSTEEMKKSIIKNLEELGVDSPAKIKDLNNKLQKEIDASAKTVENGVIKVKEAVEQNVDDVSQGMIDILTSMQTATEEGFDATCQAIVTSIEEMGVQATTELSTSSSEWATILSGAFDESGQLSENFAETIKTNLGKINITTPEQMEEWSTTIVSTLEATKSEAATKSQETSEAVTQAVTEMKEEAVAKTEEMKTEVSANTGEMSEKVGQDAIALKDNLTEAFGDSKRQILIDTAEMLANTENVGDELAENITPTSLEIDIANKMSQATLGLSTEGELFKQEASNIGESAEQNIRGKLEEMSNIELQDSLIDQEKLHTIMTNAGLSATTSFSQGWLDNAGIIKETISASLTDVETIISIPFANLGFEIEVLGAKIGILGDALVTVKERLQSASEIRFVDMASSVDSAKKSVDNLDTSSKNAKDSATKLKDVSFSPLTKSIETTNEIIKTVTKNTQDATSKMQALTRVSLVSFNASINTLKNHLRDVDDNGRKVNETLSNISTVDYTKVNESIDSLKLKLDALKVSADESKNSLKNVNTVSMNALKNELERVNTWLKNIRSSAQSARSEVAALNEARRSSASSGGNGIQSLSLDDYDLAPVSESFIEPINSMYTRVREIDLSNYQTTGGYYSSNSMSGSTVHAKTVSSQNEVIRMLQQQNQLLMQLISTEKNINLSVGIDGKQVARTTAKYMNDEINTITKRKNRFGGTI